MQVWLLLGISLSFGNPNLGVSHWVTGRNAQPVGGRGNVGLAVVIATMRRAQIGGMMGKRPNERELRRKGAAVLKELREDPVKVKLTKSQVKRLVEQLGTTPENVDELLSIRTED